MKPLDAIPIRLSAEIELDARVAMAEMLGDDWEEKRGRAAWAGFAAERAMREAWAVPSTVLEPARSLDHDLLLSTKSRGYKIEVKTRAVEAGWLDPRRFDYVVVPSHDGREPIKDVDLVWFAWYSANLTGLPVDLAHRRIWVLGYCRGPAEFYRRATFYRENEPLPRGGYAGVGGAYAIEVKQLRPFPRKAFREFIV
jgi:hypothetical protein